MTTIVMDCGNPITVAYLGNFDPQYSTENEYLDAFRRLGHDVIPVQEGSDEAMATLIDDVKFSVNGIDVVLWTRTRDLAAKVGDAAQWHLIAECRNAGVPIVGVHLDIWIGLARETQIPAEPYFHIDMLFTADGGHQGRWADYGVNHRWLLPAISERWLGLGTPRDEYRSKIAFVGSWQGQYHKEATHRHELVRWLSDTYGADCQFWPKRGQHAVRGRELNDLYASVDVVVGDSYLSAKGRYCSDRIPESLGRGAYLLHPAVEGIVGMEGGEFHRGEAPLCDYWQAFDWAELRTRINTELDTPCWREVDERQRRVDWIAESHTYTNRAQTIIDTLRDEGKLT